LIVSLKRTLRDTVNGHAANQIQAWACLTLYAFG